MTINDELVVDGLDPETIERIVRGNNVRFIDPKSGMRFRCLLWRMPESQYNPPNVIVGQAEAGDICIWSLQDFCKLRWEIEIDGKRIVMPQNFFVIEADGNVKV